MSLRYLCRGRQEVLEKNGPVRGQRPGTGAHGYEANLLHSRSFLLQFAPTHSNKFPSRAFFDEAPASQYLD
jgi:hypothetical protein